MKTTAMRFGRTTLLVLLTAFASAIMWWTSRRSDLTKEVSSASAIASAPLAAQPRQLVKVDEVEAATRDIRVRYSGKVRAWESYSLGFEIAGRVAALGENAAGAPLDDGDRVEAGQVLARLDDRALRARVAEAVANFEMAASDVERSRRARDAITEADFQNDLTRRAQAQAAQQVAEKNLEDSVLTSPVTGVIARREVEAGETVGANMIVFEIVETDRVRLVVNVPEARVRELELRRRRVSEARAAPSEDPEDQVFRAYVTLEGRDLYGKPWPKIDAQVYRIAEQADPASGLFEVEVAIENPQGMLRPGMIATADLVTDRIRAYELPEDAVMFRPGETFCYTIEESQAPLPVLFWYQQDVTVHRARRLDLRQWIDQGETILLPADKLRLASVVTRGQQRLRDGQLVRLAEQADAGSGLGAKPPRRKGPA